MVSGALGARRRFFVVEHFFLAYGLSIGCDFFLPELTPLEVVPEPDVRVRLVASRAGQRFNPPETFCDIRRARAQLSWPDVGRFELEGGRRVRIEPAPEVAETTLRAFLLGPVLSVLLYQRGFLVLHASSVALREAEGALGFLGHCGDGKSTMAATLHARGHRVVADDIAAIPILAREKPIDSHFEAYSRASEKPFPAIFPSFPQLRLWPQAVQALGEDASALPLLYPQEERRVRRVAQGFEAHSVPLRALFVLETGENLALRRFTPAQALIQLVQQTYCQNLRDPAEAAAQFQKCGALVQTLPVFGLQRPKDLSKLSDVAAFVETHWVQPESKTLFSATKTL